jgi:outer membrane protein OmpA-like peptidoglycan-associated protein
LNRKHESTSGSAKKLSYDRANTVKQYLVYKGIGEERIEVKGWGGKKMIYDENSVASKRNIRVEVEVTEE